MEHEDTIEEVDLASCDPYHVWFISDTHFDHANIIKYCNRPFKNTEEMNNFMLKTWNDTISKVDLVFFVGDMAFGRSSRKPKWWVEQLNGQKVYIKGSHDKGIRPTSEGLESVLFIADAVIIQLEDKKIYVVHEPYKIPQSWKEWTIHGHVHNNSPHLDLILKRFNVSVEVIDYKPRNLKYFLDIIDKEESTLEKVSKRIYLDAQNYIDGSFHNKEGSK